MILLARGAAIALHAPQAPAACGGHGGHPWRVQASTVTRRIESAAFLTAPGMPTCSAIQRRSKEPEASGSVMIGVDAGGRDRLAPGVLAQYRMAATGQMHRVIAPEVRIEQTRRRPARLRAEGLLDHIMHDPGQPGARLRCYLDLQQDSTLCTRPMAGAPSSC